MDILKYIKNNEIRVHVIPSSPQNKIVGSKEGILCIAIAAPADKGKANIELCKYMRKLTKRKVLVKSGEHSRDKTLFFFDCLK